MTQGRARKVVVPSLVLLGLSIVGTAQTPRMELGVERKVNQGVEPTSSQHVFHSGDKICFRFKASFDGYLYVMNRGTSGKYTVLFPRQGPQSDNRIERNREYRIPSTPGSWFQVQNPPGYDSVYFLVSPTKLEKEAPVNKSPESMPAAPDRPAAPAELLPRCDDAMFRARGDCTDVTAGPHAISQHDDLPAELPVPPGTNSRDITVINKPTTSVVAPNQGVDVPVIYEFRLAHQ